MSNRRQSKVERINRFLRAGHHKGDKPGKDHMGAVTAPIGANLGYKVFHPVTDRLTGVTTMKPPRRTNPYPWGPR